MNLFTFNDVMQFGIFMLALLTFIIAMMKNK